MAPPSNPKTIAAMQKGRMAALKAKRDKKAAAQKRAAVARAGRGVGKTSAKGKASASVSKKPLPGSKAGTASKINPRSNDDIASRSPLPPRPPISTRFSPQSNIPSSNMSWLGVAPLKKFPAPVLKPMAPFIAAGLVIAYGINAAQNASMKSDEFKNDPRNPHKGAGGH